MNYTEQEVELSIVMPCLNEAETVGICVRKAMSSIAKLRIAGEVIVADNGSTDGSQEIAAKEGATVIHVSRKGYGNALMGGIQNARGKYILMGDADDSYDFSEISEFLDRLRQNYSLVQGCRLPSGKGKVMKGAMPWLHYWIGNPGLSFAARTMFHIPVHDIYCGMRGFTKTLYNDLQLQCTGMEFATEMIIKATLFGARITEVPITLWPDGRVSRRPHLRTFRDGWRTLRFFLIYSPRWMFWYPGLALLAIGALGYIVAMPGLKIMGVTFDIHTLLVASMVILLGFNCCTFAVLTMAYAVNNNLRPTNKRVDRFFRWFYLERGIVFGLSCFLSGVATTAGLVAYWVSQDFGSLEYSTTIRWLAPAMTLTLLGASAVFSSFLCSMLGLARRN